MVLFDGYIWVEHLGNVKLFIAVVTAAVHLLILFDL